METSRRPISTAQFSWLKEESEHWRRKNLISDEARLGIMEIYESQETRQLRNQQYGMLALMSLAMFLLGLAVLLVVGYNWNGLRWETKLEILFGGLAGCYATAFYFRKSGQMFLSEVAFFLGGIVYGAGIWQIGQIFNASAHAPAAVWIWAVGVFLLALALRTPITHFLAGGLLVVWCSWEMIGYPRLGMWGPVFMRHAGWLAWLPNFAPTLAVFAVLGEWWGRKRGMVSVQFLYRLLLIYWLFLQAVAWGIGGTWPFYFILLGGGLLLAPAFPGTSPWVSERCGVVGALCVAVGLAFLSVSSYWEYSLGYHYWGVFGRHGYTAYWVFFGLCAAGFFALAVSMIRRRWTDDDAGRKAFWEDMAILFIVFVGMFFWSMVSLNQSLRHLDALSGPAYQLGEFLPTAGPFLINVLMIALALTFMHRGVRKDHFGIFTFGVCYFLLWSIIRYMALMGGEYGMLKTAGMFAFCAAVLWGMSYWWRHRGKVRSL